MKNKITNWIIKKLGGITREEMKLKEDRARDDAIKGLTGPHSIHYPEYKDKKGRLHLHSCPMGNWRLGHNCEEVPLPQWVKEDLEELKRREKEKLKIKP